MFGIGLLPTGDKDPFALRRHALARDAHAVRARLPLRPATRLLAARAARRVRGDVRTARSRARPSIRSRLHLRAPASRCASTATTRGRSTPCSACGRSAARRRRRLLGGARVRGPARSAGARRGQQAHRQHPEEVPTRRAAHGRCRRCSPKPAEQALAAALGDVGARADAGQFDSGDYTARCRRSPALRAPVDAFFDGVMVNAEDAGAARQPPGLLAALHAGDEPRRRPAARR